MAPPVPPTIAGLRLRVDMACRLTWHHTRTMIEPVYEKFLTYCLWNYWVFSTSGSFDLNGWEEAKDLVPLEKGPGSHGQFIYIYSSMNLSPMNWGQLAPPQPGQAFNFRWDVEHELRTKLRHRQTHILSYFHTYTYLRTIYSYEKFGVTDTGKSKHVFHFFVLAFMEFIIFVFVVFNFRILFSLFHF